MAKLLTHTNVKDGHRGNKFLAKKARFRDRYPIMGELRDALKAGVLSKEDKRCMKLTQELVQYLKENNEENDFNGEKGIIQEI